MVTTLVVIVVVLLAAAAVVGYLVERARQQEFAPKPAHVIDLRPLPHERVRDYRGDWIATQGRFVDDPRGAVLAADVLVERLMAERGYPPVGDAAGSAPDPAELTREQAEVVQHYQAAHEIATSGTEATDPDVLRRAMVHYRMVFSSLLEGADSQPAR